MGWINTGADRVEVAWEKATMWRASGNEGF